MNKEIIKKDLEEEWNWKDLKIYYFHPLTKYQILLIRQLNSRFENLVRGKFRKIKLLFIIDQLKLFIEEDMEKSLTKNNNLI